MVNVLIINHSSRISGAETVLLRLMDSFDSRSFKLMVACPRGELADKLEQKDIPVIQLPFSPLERTCNPFKLFRYLIGLARIHRQLIRTVTNHAIDILHCNSFTATLYACSSARRINVPLIWHMHDILQRRPVNGLFVRFAAHFADRIVCVSQAVQQNLVSFGIDRSKCRVIYNAIPTKQNIVPTFGFRETLGIPGSALIITMIGQLAAWKGQDILIDAFSKLMTDRENGNIRCLIVGDVIHPAEQNYKERILNKVREKGLEGAIIFTGFRRDVDAIIQASDIIVHASTLADPLPTVILEAMSAGRPVVATNVGGVPELIVNGKSGLIVPPGKYEDLACALKVLISNPRSREEFGREGARVARDQFGPGKNLRELTALYNSLLPPEKQISTDEKD